MTPNSQAKSLPPLHHDPRCLKAPPKRKPSLLVVRIFFQKQNQHFFKRCGIVDFPNFISTMFSRKVQYFAPNSHPIFTRGAKRVITPRGPGPRNMSPRIWDDKPASSSRFLHTQNLKFSHFEIGQ